MIHSPDPIPVLRRADWFSDPTCPIAVERQEPQDPIGLHAHDFCEIVVITGGHGQHVTGENRYDLKTGDTFVIGGARPHDYVNLNELCLINILFDSNEIPWTMGDLMSVPGYHVLFTLEPAFRERHRFDSRLRLSPMDLAHTIDMIGRLQDELRAKRPGYQLMATTMFLQLATSLSRLYDRSRDDQSRSLLQIADAISHIERNYTENVTLDELVEISQMSRRNFLRTFEQTMGYSPIQYLIRLRIRKACERLRTDRSNITEIAMSVGFTDSNYFSRKFRDVIGVSPRDYKSQY
ncbi:helix-turn-helix domain-containing protein [Neorhodopirellula pilleata]|uniref:HTH-type transcriptional activator RhaR n=1 Tax=Neorhodopirellula pilleata TaxID=2714738 RepID=A0A5C6AW17_9BACT|nr:helix-turn-helix domain-containing protein [Neorhodopirellula pilleata]TWU03641.1 HTH-type transcriptional activator RhaR [Neorhodopirellula pilleata]